MAPVASAARMGDPAGIRSGMSWWLVIGSYVVSVTQWGSASGPIRSC